MLHFKQLSNSSAPPLCRKASLPQNIKTLKTVKYRTLTGTEGQMSIIKNTVFHIVSALSHFPASSSPTPPAEYLNSLQQHTQQSACHLVCVLHPLLSAVKGESHVCS